MADAAIGTTIARPERAERPVSRRGGTPRWATPSAGWLLSLPALILMLVLIIGPVAVVMLMSMTDYQLGAPDWSFVGVANFLHLAREPVFWRSLVNTLVYALIVVPGSVAFGLGVALLIEAGRSLKGFYRAVYFVPVMATMIAMAISWEFMLHPQFGLINLTLKEVGIAPRSWLADATTALPALAAIGVWQQFGFNMVLFLAGIVSIPRHLYEAAELDGAGSTWERFRLVTWPLLGPVTVFVVVISTIRSFQVFDTVHVLTKGGPNKASEVLLYSMYAEGFEFFRSGIAAAIAVVFLLLVFLLTRLKAWAMEKRVHYG